MDNAEFAKEQWINDLVKTHVRYAMHGVWNGTSACQPYFISCRQYSPFRGVKTIFTRDIGYHSGGWWKNPDYERCFHLSISFVDPVTSQPSVFDSATAAFIAKRFFSPFMKWVWCESPFSESGKKMGVHHYRLFCDLQWQPIKPRGEVYSRELTEAGWHSFSDVQDAVLSGNVNPNHQVG